MFPFDDVIMYIYVHVYLVYILTDRGVDQLSLRITTHFHGHEEELSGPYNFTSRWFHFPCTARVTDASMGLQKSLEIHPCWTPGRSAMPWCNQWDGTKNRGESWWRHPMEIFSALLAICEGNPPVTAWFLSYRPVTRSFDVFFDVCLNKKQSKQCRCPLCGEFPGGLPSHTTSSFVVLSRNKLLNKQSIIR